VKDKLFRGAALTALKGPIVGLLARGRTGGDDAGLDRQISAVLELQRLLRLPALDSMEPPAARRLAEEGLSPLDVLPATMAEVIDTTIGGPHGPIPVRIYVPFRAGPHWIVYLHGGGGVIGSIRSSEPVTRLLAAQTGCTVASVGYRLGPEARHPAAIDDACAAWDALVARIPRSGKAVVAGDSFGGFLAAHVDRHARVTRRRRPDLQALIYPMTDLTLLSPTIDQFADGYLLTRSMMHWFRDNYLRATDDRRVPSPAHWDDLAGAAPTLVATAGFDPLVAEGDHHADRLRRAGTEVRHRRYPSLIHGFLSLAGGVTAARAAVDELCGDIMEMIA
jgi:acetyl esterase